MSRAVAKVNARAQAAQTDGRLRGLIGPVDPPAIPTFFAEVALGRRIEAAEGAMVRAAAEEIGRRPGGEKALVREMGGGVAVFTRPGEPWNKLIGLGFETVEDDAITEVERAFAEREAPLQVEFPSLGDNTIAERLTRRGYALLGFENVLGLRLAGLLRPEPPPGIAVEPTTAGDQTWKATMVTGFLQPDPSEGPKPHESFARETTERVFADVARIAGFRQYAARIGGAVAGAASLRVSGEIALLCGATTLPAFRRRGVQTALLHARLRDAAAAGCTVAAVTTQPGSKSQANAQAQGFALLYTRAILSRPPGPRGR
jgi:GNAT superfamily N-acetyltransferase